MNKEKDLNGTGVMGGGGKSQSPKVENQDKSLWWVGGFLLALIALATVLAII